MDFEVTGTVRLADNGFPYLASLGIVPLSGMGGLICYVTADRRQYQPGDTLVATMTVGNPLAEAVTLQFSTGQTYDFIIRDERGKVKLWQWSDGMAFTQALTSRALAVGESYTVSEQWTIPVGDGAPDPGLYRIFGLVNEEVSAYPLTVAITRPDEPDRTE